MQYLLHGRWDPVLNETHEGFDRGESRISCAGTVRSFRLEPEKPAQVKVPDIPEAVREDNKSTIHNESRAGISANSSTNQKPVLKPKKNNSSPSKPNQKKKPPAQTKSKKTE